MHLFRLLRWVYYGLRQAFLSFRELYTSIRASSWTTTDATVQASLCDDEFFNEIRVEYEYTAYGKYYSGQLERACFSSATARKVLDRYPERSKIFVKYHPHRPETSYLESGIGYGLS